MQKYFGRVIALGTLIVAGFFAWQWLFPGPEKVIRSRLGALAETASFQPEDGIVPKGLKLQKLLTFFTADVVIRLESRGYPPQNLNGRDELQQAASAALQVVRGLDVEFLDLNVMLGPEKNTAIVNLTCKVILAGEPEFTVQECNFMLKNVDGKWLVYRVETVKTLSRRWQPPAGSPPRPSGNHRHPVELSS